MSDTTKITNSEFKTFNCIIDFIEQLKGAICSDDNKKYHEVALYNHLIHKVKITNRQNIRRHISLFSEFCTRNQDAILKKDSSLVVFTTVKYSERVFINLGTILTSDEIDNEIKDAIWNHLLVIQASIDPSSKARNVLMGLTSSNNPEDQMLGGLIGEISKHVDENDDRNPMAIFNSLMQSGVVNKMMSSLDNSVKNGDVDMNKLGSSLQGLMSGLLGGLQGGGNSVNNSASSSSSAPNPLGGLDLGNMMSTMMGMMSGMNMGSSNTANSGLSGTNPEIIRQQLEKQIEEEMKKELAVSGETSKNSNTQQIESSSSTCSDTSCSTEQSKSS